MLVEKSGPVKGEKRLLLWDIFLLKTVVRLVIGWHRIFSFSVSCMRFLKFLRKFVPSTNFWRSETLDFSVVEFVEIIAVGVVGILSFYDKFHIFKVSFNYSIFFSKLRLTSQISFVLDRIYNDFVLIKNWFFRWDLFDQNTGLQEFLIFIRVIWILRPRIRR